MKKDSSIFIEHILENIEDIESFTKNVNKKSFLENKEKQNAVIRSLEIIGEAVKNIPQSIKVKYPKTPWKEIAGTRDKISHHYFGVDLVLIWKIVKENLSELKKEMLIIKKDI
ncbi:MAG: DUF86 domain-containing protein [Nanoarchaeota archaeon]|nr:DUF86 domain-containing protein [Nanoarchaeota archaeon]